MVLRSTYSSQLTMRRARFTHVTDGSAIMGATAEAIMPGVIIGSSPRTITTISASTDRARRGSAIAGALVGGRRHEAWRPESFGDAADLFIAGSDVNRVEESAHRCPAGDVLAHKSPQNPGKRLAWKPGRPPPRCN